MVHSLTIGSPKRKAHRRAASDEFYPYYAGFPLTFALDLIESAKLEKSAVIFDPWNGSGTTTFASKLLGHHSQGIDLNPVMVIVAKARLIGQNSADEIPLVARELVRGIIQLGYSISKDDPLLDWFDGETGAVLRLLERAISERLARVEIARHVSLDTLEPLACGLYVALFNTCRELVRQFKTSNPTWLRAPRGSEQKASFDSALVFDSFVRHAENLSLSCQFNAFKTDAVSSIKLADTVSFERKDFADFVLASPPYCTRIDYTAATRIELCILAPLLVNTTAELSKKMLGSTRVPTVSIEPLEGWGEACLGFLDKLKNHPSKASRGYYLKTHLDYFDKLFKSLGNISSCMKDGGRVVFVVQDSYYKELHNNLPLIITEMAEASGLEFRRKVDFKVTNTFAGLNPKAKKYRASGVATESVLCYQKLSKGRNV